MKSYSLYLIKYVPHPERFRTKCVDLTDSHVFITRQNLQLNSNTDNLKKKKRVRLNKSRHALPLFVNSVPPFEFSNIHYYEFYLKSLLWLIFVSFDQHATAWLLVFVTVTFTDVLFGFRISLISKPPSVILLYR